MIGKWLVLLGLAVWAGTAVAETEVAPVPGIEATINSQIEAFEADDFGAAFAFASPMIQGIFGSPARFGEMVRNGYPMVWRPGEVRYLALREIDGALWQKVLIRDQAGAVHILDYQMVRAGAAWQINAVHLLDAPVAGA